MTLASGSPAEADRAVEGLSKKEEKDRGGTWRFVRWFCLAGACSPLLWAALAYASSAGLIYVHLNEIAAYCVSILEILTFPAVFVFANVNRVGIVVGLLAIAIPLNIVWFALVGLLAWHTRQVCRRLFSLGGSPTR